ncbi:MAG TPA: penicillin-binding protein 1B [Gammaproteobacteria bacterium]|nr:penicillin-binding protein 1B [Gammaproteobacteria bacterium]
MARKVTRKTRRKAPRQQSTRRRKSTSRRRAPRRNDAWYRCVPWKKVLAGLAVLVVLYVGYLDYRVRSQFEGKRWALPAHVYARPLELREDLALPADRFERELALLGYRLAYDTREPGTYNRQNRRFRLHTRGFEFWDDTEPARQVEIRFYNGRVDALTDVDAQRALSLLRLDPMFIGGIYPDQHEDRLLIRLDEAPAVLVRGLVAVEDRRFYEHWGVNPRAIARALWANIRAGATVQGGSTLTQQLAKNFFLSNARTLWRKGNEAIMALLLELHYSKDEILEAYLNEVSLGQQGQRAIHGFGLAAHFYFDRPLAQLDNAELATLVALVQGPGLYDPRRHPQRLKKRRDLVLEIFAAQGVISPAEAREAMAQDLTVVKRPSRGITPYPAFMDMVRRQLRESYRKSDLTSEGLRIFTTLDPLVQSDVEDALRAQVKRLDRARGLGGKLEGAALVTSTTGGELLAMVGGRQVRFAGFNRALDARRQVGSLVKPAVYLTALMERPGTTLVSPVSDTPIRIQGPNGDVWSPKNYNDESHGVVPLYVALTRSYNQATVRLGMQVGVDRVVAMLRRLGLERDVPAYPALLLGSQTLTPLEVTRIYQTLAAEGFRSPLTAIREVLTADGEPLQRYPLDVEPAVDPLHVQIINSALREVMRHGTGRNAVKWFPAAPGFAGKTGTTNDLRDSWFAGFGQEHLMVVWLGSDDNRSTGLTGASGALAVWSDAMARMASRPLAPLADDQLVLRWVEPVSGRRVGASCPEAAQLAFLPGTEPQEAGQCPSQEDADWSERAMDWLRRLLE